MRWALLVVVLLILPLVNAEIAITEIMYNLEGTDSGREWIEVYSSEAIDLTEYRLYEAETNHYIKATGNATFSGYAIIADKPEKFLVDYSDYEGSLFDSAFSLSNTGEELALKLNDEVINLATYSIELGANGDSNTLQLAGGSLLACKPTPGTATECSKSEQLARDSKKQVADLGKNDTRDSILQRANDSVWNSSDDEIVWFIPAESPSSPVQTTTQIIEDKCDCPSTQVVYRNAGSELSIAFYLLLAIAISLNVVMIVSLKS